MKKKQKILYIVRHAKSSWDYDNIADVDRPLKPKGIKSAYEIARAIRLKNTPPDRIMSSPANRALHTALIFARVFDLPAQWVIIDDGLYESSVAYCLEKIRKSDDSIQTLMIVGHNPDFTDLANQFLKVPLSGLPTTGVVRLMFTCDHWQSIGKETLTSHHLIFPAKETE